MDIEAIAADVVDEAYHIHRDLGPGLLESVYERLLAHGLRRRGHHVERQRSVTFEYEGQVYRDGLKVDLLVDGCLVVEVKAAEKTLPVFLRQVFTYLKLMDLPLGLLVNFGSATIKEGLHRIVNDYHPTGSTPLRIHRDQRPDHRPEPVTLRDHSPTTQPRSDAPHSSP